MAKGDSKQVTISVDQLQERANRITEIDSKIAAASGNDSQIRKALIEEMLSQNAEPVTSLYDSVIGQFKSLDGPVLVGLVAKLEEAMKGELKTLTDSVVDEKVKAQASTEGVDVNALKEQRKQEVELFRALYTMLDSLGLDVSEIKEPKRSGGGRPAGSGGGKSGKNKEGYRFSIDGKDRPDSQNSFSSLAYYATEGLKDPVEAGGEITTAAEGEKSRLTSKALRTWLEQQGVKYGEQDTWEIKLPNGKVIGARREVQPETPAGDVTPEEAPVELVEEPATV